MKEDKIISATLADIYHQQGHYERAVEMYQVLIRKDPANPVLKEKLAAIRNELKAREHVPAFRKLLKTKLW